MIPTEVAAMMDAIMEDFGIDEERALRMAWRFYRIFHPEAQTSEEENRMPDYKKISYFLFQLLDDIDTTEDIAKSNDKAFREVVHKLHRRRFEVADTDGYTVTFK